jgi:hypothetical protein
VATRHTERVAAEEPTVLGKHHPVEDVLAIEGKPLANLMPLLQFWWNFKETAREHALGSVVMDTGKPEENEPVLAQTLTSGSRKRSLAEKDALMPLCMYSMKRGSVALAL